METSAPTGMGLYQRRLGSQSPKRNAKRAKDHGLSHVSLMGPWQEPDGGRIVTRIVNGADKLLRHAEAFDAVGIEPLVWFYPWAGEEGRILEFVRRLLDRGAPIRGLLPDPELGSKWKGGKAVKGATMRGAQGEAIRGSTRTTRALARRAAERLMRGLAAIVEEYRLPRGVGVTSYGVLRYHKTLPIEQLLRTVPVWLSPQLYTATPDLVDGAIEDWRERAGQADLKRRLEVVPSFATFGPNSRGKLLRHLISFVDGDEDVRGLNGWAWPQTSAEEWRTIAMFASWLERGVCALGGAPPAVRRALERVSR